MSRTRFVASTLVVAAAVACKGTEAPPQAQWLVIVATDAAVPDFGDQVELQILDDHGGVLNSQSRLVDGARSSSWPLSFGVAAVGGRPPPRVRALLFRLDETSASGNADPHASIDATGRLPEAHGITSVVLSLSMACFGVSSQLDAALTCDSTTGELAPEPTLGPYDPAKAPTVASWPAEAHVDCRTAAPTGMVCVPGGAFLMGSAEFVPQNGEADPTPQHLVQLSPFALDLDEVTIGAIRPLLQSEQLTPPPLTRVSDQSTDGYGYCNYLGSDQSSADQASANCLSWQTASRACALLGKRLPTEAEWEYAAGNLGLKTRYPWGADTDYCSYAVVERGFGGLFTRCRTRGSQVLDAGPVIGGNDGDITLLSIRNLGGNLSEFVSSSFEPYSGPCWRAQSSWLFDPQCDGGTVAPHAVRGGNWAGDATFARSTARQLPPGDGPSSQIGFRCAQSM